MSAAPAYFIGLMSGTSMDGVDAVLADFSAQPRLIASYTLALPPSLRAQLLALNSPQYDDLRLAAEASLVLARLYADAVAGVLSVAGLTAGEVQAVGCHGQTVRHRPEIGYSLQLNAPALLAELCGIAVVADFRNRDVAAGGQGAPLVPAFHDRVLRADAEHRVVLNLGGIANVTWLTPDAPVIGFDTGPANALMNGWAERHLGCAMDVGGAWAAGGTVLPESLARMLAHPFFALPPPKSCGREEFSLAWLDAQLTGVEAPQDVQATLVELSASSIAAAIARHCAGAERVLLCGGGAHNDYLVQRIAALCPDAQIEPSDAVGVPGDWLEAFAFAWLARACLLGEAGNLPAVTGARGLRVLGAIYPA